MRRTVFLLGIVLFVASSALAQYRQYQGRLSPDDQRRFDSYYQRWEAYRSNNDRDQVISMEKRMQDVMSHYQIPLNVPFEVLASSPANERFGRYRGRFSPDDQRRFDSYFQRWLGYKRDNNRDDVISMEKRMQDVMGHYSIPLNVPYDVLASNGGGNDRDDWRSRDDHRDHDRDEGRDRDHDRDRDHWRHVLSRDDQGRFDSYYSHWLDDRRRNDDDEIHSMERRMRDVMQRNNIPADVSFDRIASNP